jgi:hypothetical protein
LHEEPFGESPPIGAPVTPENKGAVPIPVPAGLSLKSEFVSGQVMDPSGTVRGFHSLMRCVLILELGAERMRLQDPEGCEIRYERIGRV